MHCVAGDLFGLMLESTGAAVLIIGADGKIQFVNAATEQMFGYRRDELIGKVIEFLIPLRLRRKHAFLRRQFLARPSKRSIGGRSLVGARRDGAEFPVEIGLSPVETEPGSSVVTTVFDISSSRQATDSLAERVAELERANQRLSQFAVIACHDLQEPLLKIAQLSQALEEAFASGDQQRIAEASETMRQWARDAHELVQGVLTYARATNAEFDTEILDLRQEIQRALHDLSAPLAETRTQTTLDAPSLKFRADRRQFMSLMRNILSNAIKYRKPGQPPRISITASREDGFIRLRVADEGIGFDDAFAEMIFEPFRQLRCKTDYAGSGVELAACKAIADRHGWEISVQSQPGQGAAFSLVMPELTATPARGR